MIGWKRKIPAIEVSYLAAGVLREGVVNSLMELSFPFALVCTSTWLSLISMMSNVSMQLGMILVV